MLSLDDVRVGSHVKFTVEPLASQELAIFALILSETVFLALVILPGILGNDLFFVRVPYCRASARHKAGFPCAIVFHCRCLVYAVSLLVTLPELSFVQRPVLKVYFAISMHKIVAEVSFICELFVNTRYQFAFALHFPLFEFPFINGFILVLSINSISINHVIFPLSFVNVSVVKNCKSLAVLYLKFIKAALV